MRIAFVVSNLTYPPREGLHQQTIATARLLAGPERELHFFGFVRDASILDEVALLEEVGLRFHTTPIPTRLPDILLGLANRLFPFRSRRIMALCEALETYDVIHLENVGATGLVRRHTAHRTVLGLIDPGTLRWRRFAENAHGTRARLSARFKQFLHLALERLILTPGSLVHVVSKPDGTYLQERYPKVRVTAIPVSLPADLEQAPPPPPAAGRPILLVFMDLRQAHLRRSFLWFGHKVLARCGPARAAELIVLGRVHADQALVDALGGQQASFISWADDYRVPLAMATVVATPDLVGTGLKNRVSQSMAMGRPVIGTSIAFEGIEIVAGRDAEIADDPAEMAARLDELIVAPEKCAAMGARGREAILAQLSRSHVQQQWLELYQDIIERAREPI